MDAVARQATRYDAIQGRFDPWLLGIALALVCLGVVMVGSASVAIAEDEGSSPYYYLIRHAVFISGGLLSARLAAAERLVIDPALISRGRKAARGRHIKSMIDADMAFHHAIYAGSGNPLIVQIADLGKGLERVTIWPKAARRAGYSCVLLDTLDDMESARALYTDLGFEEVPPYYHNPIAGAHYLKVDLF